MLLFSSGFAWNGQGVANENPVVFDASGHLLVSGTWGVSEAADAGFGTEVDDQAMRVIGLAVFPGTVPKIRGLAVDGVGGGAVLTGEFLAINIGDGPFLVGNRVALWIEHIELGDGGEGLVVVSVERLDAELTAGDGFWELNFL